MKQSESLIPKDDKEYIKWHENNLKESIGLGSNNHKKYSDDSDAIKTLIIGTGFWKEFASKYNELEQIFYTNNDNCSLFTRAEVPEILIKPFGSLTNKIYRKNKKYSKNFSDIKQENLIYVRNSYEHIKDIFRTTVVVRYIDGINFIIDEFDKICDKLSIEKECSYENRDSGYYAVHYCIKQTMPLVSTPIYLEIQITTQFQELLKKLLHKYYETSRVNVDADLESWKWDYKSDKFSTQYIGHTLHFLEGIITKLRQQKERTENDF